MQCDTCARSGSCSIQYHIEQLGRNRFMENMNKECNLYVPRKEVKEKRPKKQCGICHKALTTTEIEESNRFIGGGRYFCEKHLNQKMDW